MFRNKQTIARLSGTIAVAASLVAVGAQTAVAQAKAHSASNPSFITDTLAPGGTAPVQGYRLITDTLAPGGGVSIQRRWFVLEHSSPAAEPQGYRFITDTLAPGGGTTEVSVPATSGFDWADAGIGAGVMAGLGLMLLGSARLLQRRRVLAV